MLILGDLSKKGIGTCILQMTDLFGVREQQKTISIEIDLAGCTVKKGCAKLFFQAFNMFRQGRLGDEQFVSGFQKVFSCG